MYFFCFLAVRSFSLELIIIAVADDAGDAAVVAFGAAIAAAAGAIQRSEHELAQDEPEDGQCDCRGHVNDRDLLLGCQGWWSVHVLVLGSRRRR